MLLTSSGVFLLPVLLDHAYSVFQAQIMAATSVMFSWLRRAVPDPWWAPVAQMVKTAHQMCIARSCLRKAFSRQWLHFPDSLSSRCNPLASFYCGLWAEMIGITFRVRCLRKWSCPFPACFPSWGRTWLNSTWKKTTTVPYGDTWIQAIEIWNSSILPTKISLRRTIQEIV